MLRKITGTLLSLVVGTAGFMMAAPSAQAGSYLDCRGFSACSAKGFGSAGFNKVYTRSHWRAAAGHNCTNYVAYRLTNNGRLTSIPEGTGSAWKWGATAKSRGIPVAQLPRVGDVAWWNATANVGNGTGGHVAYVERVYSNGSIRVSEDNYGGTFDWRRLTKGNTWPTGFIRYPKSNGSPVGRVASAKVTNADAGTVTVTGYVTEADHYTSSSMQLYFGGPKSSAITPVVATRTGTWTVTRTFGTGKIPDSVYVYASNTAPTPGVHRAIGSNSILNSADDGPLGFLKMPWGFLKLLW